MNFHWFWTDVQVGFRYVSVRKLDTICIRLWEWYRWESWMLWSQRLNKKCPVMIRVGILDFRCHFVTWSRLGRSWIPLRFCAEARYDLNRVVGVVPVRKLNVMVPKTQQKMSRDDRSQDSWFSLPFRHWITTWSNLDSVAFLCGTQMGCHPVCRTGIGEKVDHMVSKDSTKNVPWWSESGFSVVAAISSLSLGIREWPPPPHDARFWNWMITK